MMEHSGNQPSARHGGFTDLIAWQKSYALVLSVYKVSSSFPSDERFGLIQQVRRAALSIPCNIAEGWGRGTTTDYLRFLYMARGSTNEIQTQMWVARDLGHLPPNHEVNEQIEEVQRLINGLIRSLIDKTESTR